MLKKFVVLLACTGLILQLSSCTSKDSIEDGDELAVDVAAADSAEVETVEGEENLDIMADDSTASLSEEALPEDALGEAPPDPTVDALSEDPMMAENSGAPPAAESSDDFAANDLPPVDLPADTLAESSLPDESVVENVPPVVEQSEPTSDTMAEASTSHDTYEEPKKETKPVVSYRKVEATPWRESGKLLNTAYVAREGDSWASVSTMIYGSEKVAELKKLNPQFKSRQLKVGDKLYYNSPHRPDDDTKVLTYYEDNGMAPEVYITKSGDKLRQVAKELFGSEQAWKELYATNEFESKGGLDEGTQIKYWRGSAASQHKEVAASQPPAESPEPMAEMAPPPPPPDQMAEMAPPPPPPDQMGEMAPPPPPPDQMAEMAPPPPPPPPVEAIAPPPPPPPMQNMAKVGDEADQSLDEDQTQMLAAGAIAFVGLALFIMLRRRRRRELEQAIQDTQVG